MYPCIQRLFTSEQLSVLLIGFEGVGSSTLIPDINQYNSQYQIRYEDDLISWRFLHLHMNHIPLNHSDVPGAAYKRNRTHTSHVNYCTSSFLLLIAVYLLQYP